MEPNRKFFVELLRGVSHKQYFWLIWTAIVGGFCYMMYSFYKKANQRNFKEGAVQMKGPTERLASPDTTKLASTKPVIEGDSNDTNAP